MTSKNPTVLILDDDTVLLEMYTTKFEKDGFNVIKCVTANDALDALRGEQKPDAIISDLIMPQTDGFEFLEAVESGNLRGNAKLVILSNKNEPDDLARGKALGVAKYLVKANLLPSDVVREVRAILS